MFLTMNTHLIIAHNVGEERRAGFFKLQKWDCGKRILKQSPDEM